MAKLVTILLALTTCVLAHAADGPDASPTAVALYPMDEQAQAFATRFLTIAKNHGDRDPLLGQGGPAIHAFNLNEILFAFVVNARADVFDLILFHYDGPMFKGLERDAHLTTMSGEVVYAVRDLSRKTLTDDDQIRGAYFDGTPASPIRSALGKHILNIIWGERHPDLDAVLRGIYRRQSFEDVANQSAVPLRAGGDARALLDQLSGDKNLEDLFSLYIKIVMSVGDVMKHGPGLPQEFEVLGELRSVIVELRTRYPNAWAYIWTSEYAEGFPRYGALYSLLQVRAMTYPMAVEQQREPGASFVARSGALAGLYLGSRLRDMPFANHRDLYQSAWEVVIHQTMVKASELPVAEIMNKYKEYPLDSGNEMRQVKMHLQTLSAASTDLPLDH